MWTRVNGVTLASFTVMKSLSVFTSVICSVAAPFASRFRAEPRYQPALNFPPLTLIVMSRFSPRSRNA